MLLPLIGGLGGLFFGIIFGYVSTRRAGTPFALISLGIGELIAASSLMLPSFFGGEEGISGDRMAEITLTPFGFGQQIEGEQNPIVDCFTRVENIPKSVLNKCVEVVSWENTGDYLAHFEDIPLGPNVGAFVPHSMLRVEVMGLADSIGRDPTESELAEMEPT